MGHTADNIRENAELLALKADDLEGIKEHFGTPAQYEKLAEELLELHDELISCLSGRMDLYKVLDEMADVQIVLAPLAAALGAEKYRRCFLDKISRTKMRIKSGYYGGTSDKVEGGHIGFDRCLAGE